MAAVVRSLGDLIVDRAGTLGETSAFSFLDQGTVETDSLTYARLLADAARVATALSDLGAERERVLLLFPPGLDFVRAFFGCLLAGAAAVPAAPVSSPRNLPRLLSILRDSRPKVVVGPRETLRRMAALLEREPHPEGMELLPFEDLASSPTELRRPRVGAEALALLQYTSGSTSDPKGVMVSHGNLLHNEETIRRAFGTDESSVILGWLPHFHDMGLIGNILQPVYLGARCVLMPPAAFLKRPACWLTAIADHRATVSGGPNFAYDLCVEKIGAAEREGLDLSSWRLAFNGAEPIRAESLDRFAAAFSPHGFRREALYCCYGLAEATLFVTGGRPGRGPTVAEFSRRSLEGGEAIRATVPGDAIRLVGSGYPAGEVSIAVVEAETGRALAEGWVGEIVVGGPSVAQGYWRREIAAGGTFGGSHAILGGEVPAVRTGDLGFVAEGELFVTGRSKDLIIVRGRNLYPQDLEGTAVRADPALTQVAAAFAVERDGREGVVLVCEVDREASRSIALEPIAEQVARAIAEEHEVEVDEVVLVRPGGVPRTTSGKVRRGFCRDLWRGGELAVAVRSVGRAIDRPIDRQAEAEPVVPSDPLDLAGFRDYLSTLVRRASRRAVDGLERRPFTSLGLDSLALLELSHRIERDLHVAIDLGDLLEGESIESLAGRLAGSARRSEDAREPGGDEIGPSVGQRALWVLHQLAPESSAHHLVFAADLPDGAEAAPLRAAFLALAARHGALRTSYPEVAGEPSARLHPEEDFDFAEIEAGAHGLAVEVLAASEAHRPFDLTTRPPVRVRVIVGAAGRRVLLCVAHHIAIDLWSFERLLSELESMLLDRRELPAVRQAADYARWQTARLAGGDGEAIREFWRRALDGIPSGRTLFAERERGRDRFVHRASRSLRSLEPDLVERARAFAEARGATLFALLLATFDSVLARYADAEHFAVAVSASGRSHPWQADVVGYLTNPLFVPAAVSGERPFAALVAQVQANLSAALAHQDLPASIAIEEARRQGMDEAEVLLDVLFVFNASRRSAWPDLPACLAGAARTALSIAGQVWQAWPIERVQIPCELELDAVASGPALALSAEFALDLFDRATVDRLLAHLECRLRGAIEAPDRALDDLPLLSSGERDQLQSWARGPRVAARTPLLHQLVEEGARRTPDAIAVEGAGAVVSYGALDLAASRLAVRLLRSGLAIEGRVGVLCERTPELVVALIAVLKAGGCLVPLDPRFPAERIGTLLGSAGARILVTDRASRSLRLPELARFELEVADLDAGECSIALPSLDPSHLAYVIYTSGSTGEPKGVGVAHAAIATYVATAARSYGIDRGDRVLQMASIAFDASAEEIYPTLARGATLVLSEPTQLASPQGFLEAAERRAVTVLDLPTLYWHELAAALQDDADLALPRSVRLVILGGERAELGALEVFRSRARPGLRIVNTYGPTEATVVATSCEVAGAEAVAVGGSVPIGLPVHGTSAVVLDSRFRRVPVGCCGELFLGGAGLARGYLDQAGATALRFLPNPWPETGGERLYRTGDLVRRREDGLLEFLGRRDRQLKVRGFRVELAEVEECLRGHVAVRQVAVEGRPDARGALRLVAFVSFGGGAAPAVDEVRQYARERLPDFMVPAVFVALDALPTTVSGKIDRRLLATVDAQGDEAEFVAPQTPTEEIVAQIWASCLEREGIGRDDDFFALGGHSLLATQVVSRLRGVLGIELPLRVLFEATTVARLARAIDAASGIALPPIEPTPRDVPVRLSFAQERLWLLDRLNPGSVAYLVPRVVHVEGELVLPALAAAYERLIERHETLRTVVRVEAGLPYQRILPPAPFPLPAVDLAALAEPRAQVELRRLIGVELTRPFDLEAGPLLRAVLVDLGGFRRTLVQTEHHIVHDGWTQGVFLDDLLSLYQAVREGTKPKLSPLPIQYVDYSAWQRNWLQGDVLARQLDFWQAHLAGAPEQIGLPIDRPRPATSAQRGNTRWFELDAAATLAVAALSRRAGVTQFMTLLGAFAALLFRLTGRGDVVIGTPIANRTHEETEGLLGFFVNSLPLRVTSTPETTGLALLGAVREITLAAYAHQHLPFELMVARLAPDRSLAYNPIFQVMYILQNAPVPPLELPGLTLRYEELHNRTAKFDLVVSQQERDGRLGSWIEYNVELFDESTILRIVGAFARLVASLAAHPDRRLGDLSCLSAAERQALLVEWATAGGAERGVPAVHRAVREVAGRRPDAIALQHGAQHLTYRGLLERAAAVADGLAELGVTTDRPVGICLERGLDLPVAVLGVALAGGAALPLDPSYPAERLSFMVRDSGLGVLIARGGGSSALPADALEGVRVVAPADLFARGSSAQDRDAADALSLLYVLYTSGSTGRPKGVGMPHGAFANLMAWQLDEPGQGEPLRTLQFAALSFDVSFQEIYATWMAGGTLIEVDAETRRDASALLQLIGAEQVERIFLPFVALQQLADAASFVGHPPALREVVTAGEQLQVTEPVKALFEGLAQARLFNQYGPTEAHVVSSLRLRGGPREWERLPPIGRPVSGLRLVVLDRDGGPAPIGAAGELAIGGAGLARGYVGRPEITAERFTVDPDAGRLVPAGARLYLTGDVARLRADGEIQYLGRKDQQVKVRGHRVEPGEIEAALASHPGIAGAVVLAQPTRVGGHRLVAYVAPAAVGAVPPRSELEEFLRRSLPEAMIPAVWMEIEALPLTPSGKVDRRNLPALAEASSSAADYVAPEGWLEGLIAGVFGEVLGLERVGATDGFFALGGHSLLGTQVTSRLRRELGREVPLALLFERQTVADLARALDGLIGEPQRLPGLVRLGLSKAPLSFGQERLWFLDQVEGASGSFCVPFRMALRGCVDARRLAEIATQLAARHEVLRTRYVEEDGSAWQVVAAAESIPVPVVDLAGMPRSEVERVSRREATRGFDLSSGPMLRAALLRAGDELSWWLLTLHHIASDGWSIGVMLREIERLWRVESLEPLRFQVSDHAVWQRSAEVTARMGVDLDWWRRELSGAPPELALPGDRPRPAVPSHRGVLRSMRLAYPSRLEAFCRERGATLFAGFVALLQGLLVRVSGDDEVVIGTPVAGRTELETEDLIGFFVNLLPLRGRVDLRAPWSAQLGKAQATVIGALGHASVPFARLVEEVNPVREAGREPIFQALLIHHNEPFAKPELDGVSWSVDPIDAGTTRYDLTVTLMADAGELWCGWTGALDLFDPSTVERLGARFRALVDHAGRAPETPLGDLDLWTEAERHALSIERNDTARRVPPEAVFDRLGVWSREVPDRVAVVAGERHLSYACLARAVGAVTVELGRRGLGLEDRVGVSLARTEGLLIAILGIQGAGCAYVPLDPGYPKERLEMVAEDAGLSLLITEEPWSGELWRDRAARGEVLLVDAAAAAAESASRAGSSAPGNALAYVLFTSGSTGRPKGVAVEHRSLANFLDSMAEALRFGAEDRALNVASLSFDIAGLELFLPIWVGGGVEIASEAEVREGSRLRNLAERCGARLVQATPASWRMLLEAGWNGSRGQLVGSAGEALPGPLAEELLARSAEAWNFYGPTETTVYSTIWRAARGEPVSLGSPLGETEVYVLDRDLRPLGLGGRGEIYIGGEGVARGYFGRADLTAERFVPDGLSGRSGGRLYATGDGGCARGSRLEYLGRADGQVKLRGYRIELGEIESVLRREPTVKAAVVSLAGERLVAYVVNRAATALDGSSLARRLLTKLPSYMVPSAWVELESLPLTPNGKVDRKRLPPPDLGSPATLGRSAAWRSPQEELVAQVYADLLGRPVENRDDDFFALGGHSLLAARAASRLRTQTGGDVSVRALFEAPRVLDLAARLARAEAATDLPIERGRAPYPLSLAQLQVWRNEALDGASTSYSVPVACELSAPLDWATFDRLFARLQARHEILRTAIVAAADGEPMQIVGAEVRRASAVDLAAVPRPRGRSELQRIANAEARRPIDLHGSRLWRLIGCHLGGGHFGVSWVFHHVAVDAWSLSLLLRDLRDLVRFDGRHESAATEHEARIQYGDFARWQRSRWTAERLESEVAFWRERLRGAPDAPDLREDGDRIDAPGRRAEQFVVELDPPLVERLRELGRRHGATLYMIYLAGLACVLSETSRESTVVIGSAMAQRPTTLAEELVGPCVNLVPLRIELAGEPTIGELLARVRGCCLEAFAHQELPFEQLVEALRPKRRPGRLPMMPVVCTAQNALPSIDPDAGGLDLHVLPVERGTSPYDLNLNLFVAGSSVRIAVEFRPDLFKRSTVEGLVGRAHRWLAGFAEHPDLGLDDVAVRIAARRRLERRAPVGSISSEPQERPRLPLSAGG